MTETEAGTAEARHRSDRTRTRRPGSPRQRRRTARAARGCASSRRRPSFSPRHRPRPRGRHRGTAADRRRSREARGKAAADCRRRRRSPRRCVRLRDLTAAGAATPSPLAASAAATNLARRARIRFLSSSLLIRRLRSLRGERGKVAARRRRRRWRRRRVLLDRAPGRPAASRRRPRRCRVGLAGVRHTCGVVSPPHAGATPSPRCVEGRGDEAGPSARGCVS